MWVSSPQGSVPEGERGGGAEALVTDPSWGTIHGQGTWGGAGLGSNSQAAASKVRHQEGQGEEDHHPEDHGARGPDSGQAAPGAEVALEQIKSSS